MTDANRRADTRVRAHKIQVWIKNDQDLRERYLRDLSEGGLFILSDPPSPVGTELDVELLPPGWAEPLLLRGTVVRIADDAVARSLSLVGMGVQLDPPSQWTRVRLEALLVQHGAKRSEPSIPVPDASPPTLPRRDPANEVTNVDAGWAALTRERDQLQQLRAKLEAELSERTKQSQASIDAEAKLEEAMAELTTLTRELEQAQSRIDANVAKLARLEGTAKASQELAQRLAEERDHHSARLQELSEEVSELRRLVRRGRRLVPYLLVALLGALALSVYLGTPWARWGQGLVALVWSDAEPTEAPTPAAEDAGARPTVHPDAGEQAVAAVLVPLPDAGSQTDAGVAEDGSEEADGGQAPTDQGESQLILKSKGVAIVHVDGKKVGKTPVVLKVKPGTHRVRFECVEPADEPAKTVKVKVKPDAQRELVNRCGK